MPIVLPAGIARVQMTYQVTGTPDIAVGTFWLNQGQAVLDETRARAAVNAVKAFYGSLSSSLQGMTLLRNSVYRSNYSGEMGGDWEQSWTFPDITQTIAGGAGAGLPPQVAIVLSLVSSSPNRSGKGRLYLGPLTGAIVSSSGSGPEVGTSTITSINSAATTLRNALAAGGNPWVVFSRTKQEAYPVLATRVGNRFDTQRRRRSAFRESYTAA